MRKILALAVLVSVLATPAALAQEEYLELLREDLKTGKVALLTEALQLTAEEGEVFWPIHREYQVELAALGDQYIKNLKQYAETFESMDDESAKAVADAFFKQEEDKLKLWKKYYKKVAKAVTPRRAAQFIQLENQIDLLIGVQIAAETPLIQ